jgi:hypothetical protein
MKDPSWNRPIGDARAWLKTKSERDRQPYLGPSPEEHSPANHAEEERALREVLFGVRLPRSGFEREFLRYMGGIQEEPPHKWVACACCKTEFKAKGYPGRHGRKALYPDICQSCSDELSAGLKRLPTWKPAIRPVVN